MKLRLRLLITFLLICALVPTQSSFATVLVDREEDGINIDDVVYHLSQTGTVPESDIIALLNQIAPINQLTVYDVAAMITYIEAPAVDETSLLLPNVPIGYSISIHSSSNSTIIGTDGVITPPADVTIVALVLRVTRTSDNTTANTSSINVSVPAEFQLTPAGYTYCANEGGTCDFIGSASVAFGADGLYNYLISTSSIACSNEVFGDPIGGVPKSCYYAITTASVAAGITSVASPTIYESALSLPNVPTGYNIAISYSSDTTILATNGTINHPEFETSVNLVLTVTGTSDNSNANTVTITVVVPAEVITPPGANVASAVYGGRVSASSTHSSGFSEAGINNGDRLGLNWGNGGGWNDGTHGGYPDWVRIDFAGKKTINEIDVFTIQDNYGGPSVPTSNMTFSTYGINDFSVQYLDDMDDLDPINDTWVTVTDGNVIGNNNVWRNFNFSPIETRSIKLTITKSQDGTTRVIELEAWTPVED